MSIRVQFLGRDEKPVAKGLRIALLEDGRELAVAETDEQGFVSFPIDAGGKEKLSVRLLPASGAPPRKRSAAG